MKPKPTPTFFFHLDYIEPRPVYTGDFLKLCTSPRWYKAIVRLLMVDDDSNPLEYQELEIKAETKCMLKDFNKYLQKEIDERMKGHHYCVDNSTCRVVMITGTSPKLKKKR